jgi:hypothetical protein
MMADKYLSQESGNIKEVEATTTSTGVSEAGKLLAANPQGKLDSSLLPPGIGADTNSVEASENLAAGDFVNVYDDSGTPKCRKADATVAGKEASGFVLDAVVSGASATVYGEGTNNQLSGLVAGMQYLSTTAGQCSNVAPSSSGNVIQKLGTAMSATALNFEAGQTIELV